MTWRAIQGRGLLREAVKWVRLKLYQRRAKRAFIKVRRFEGYDCGAALIDHISSGRYSDACDELRSAFVPLARIAVYRGMSKKTRIEVAP